MSPMNLLKTFVIVLVLGFLANSDSAEARGLGASEQQNQLNPISLANTYHQVAQQQSPTNMMAGQQANLDQSDSDGDDEDDDVAPLIPANLPMTNQQQGGLVGNQFNEAQQYLGAEQAAEPSAAYMQLQQQQVIPTSSDLKSSASKHYHHGHGAKGWLDMGAWTGKKGAFGWYDKHPVGKGK